MGKIKILTFNCHESYVYSLSRIGYNWDVIDNLPGRYTFSWDTSIRLVPDNVRLISLDECLKRGNKYHCIIAHNVNDLLDVKTISAPKILVIHVSLTGYIQQEGSVANAENMRLVLRTYLDKIKGLTVSVSPMKQKTWGVSGPIIPFFIDSDYFHSYTGVQPFGLRVVNQISSKDILLDWSSYLLISDGFPVKLVGYNPDIHGVESAKNIEELRRFYQNYRFYIHTAKYDYEDGYNLASLEAMATGMPIVCNLHPSSPIIDGVNGFMSDDMDELRERIKELLKDRDLAIDLGRAARETVLDGHSLSNFVNRWRDAIDEAIEVFNGSFVDQY